MAKWHGKLDDHDDDPLYSSIALISLRQRLRLPYQRSKIDLQMPSLLTNHRLASAPIPAIIKLPRCESTPIVDSSHKGTRKSIFRFHVSSRNNRSPSPASVHLCMRTKAGPSLISASRKSNLRLSLGSNEACLAEVFASSRQATWVATTGSNNWHA